jgi:hypothetical protein
MQHVIARVPNDASINARRLDTRLIPAERNSKHNQITGESMLSHDLIAIEDNAEILKK